MGQQQLLLIILGVIIVGVAIAVGISLFSGQSMASNRDAILSDLSTLGSDANQYRIRPSQLGGGNGSYAGYVLLSTGTWGTSNPNATYTVTTQTQSSLVLTANSKQVSGGSVVITFDGNGNTSGNPVVSGF